ncbi:MAG: FlgD immunoglobulin-like domain containing protein [Bacteroidota bacterium]
MKKFLLFFAAPALLVGALFLLSSNHTSPIGVSEEAAEATFVGSDACKTCHSDKYDTWIESGHPYKFTVVENGVEPTYPAEAVNFQAQWMDSLGDGSHTWNDIAGVIGGYGWKSRFVGTDGHVVGSGGSAFSAGVGHNQFNFYGGEDHGWVDYETSNMNKVYNYGCFKCHTTGGDTTGTWLAGVDGLGNFTEGGIGCESCHGPGSEHAASPSTDNIDRVYEFAHHDNSLGGLEIYGVVQTPDPASDDINFLCGTCHNRGYTNSIDAKGGYIKHHEQWDELMSGPHTDAGLTCKTCHNPHVRTIWDGDGITKTCSECHTDQVATVNHSGGATCIDCHMAYAAKSGTTRGKSGYKGDVRSHLLKITADTASMFTEDGSAVRDDDTRAASLSPGHACLGCHNDDPDDGIPDKTLEEAAAGAAGMHVDATRVAISNELNLGIYPNPSSGPTRISVDLPSAGQVGLSIYNASGQVVYELNRVVYPQGTQEIFWDGRSNNGSEVNPGYYFIKVSSGALTAVDKLVLMK